MDDPNLLGSSDWRTRSPDADQEYFIDKMRMLKIRLRKYEEVSATRDHTYPCKWIVYSLISGEPCLVPLSSRAKVRC